MKISGGYSFDAPRHEVWKALMDPAVLARTLPGCEALEVTGPDRYAVTVTAGVASIKGTYAGQVELGDKDEPNRYTMRASGQGGPGTIDLNAVVDLHEHDDGTRLAYDVDAVVGGMVGGVGQRVLTGVAKRTANEFFTNVERDIAGEPIAVEPAGRAAEPTTLPERERAEAAAPATGQVFRPGPRPARAETDVVRLLAAAVVGAAIALIGVVIGRRSAR